nr:Type 1 glutamine amidotransferase-like domain-containing protein [Lysinibacter cavernae]
MSDRAGAPTVAVVIVHEGDGDARANNVESVLSQVDGVSVTVRTLLAEDGQSLRAEDFMDVDGIVVAGGLTPVYRTVLSQAAETIRELVGGGVPYLGFSAGAAIAAERALIGGWQIGGVQVAPEPASEGLDEVTIADGLGLIDLSIEVHAAQWGTLTRLIAAAEAGLVEAGIGLDEETALIVGQGPLRVVGAGSVWRVQTADSRVIVSSMGA